MDEPFALLDPREAQLFMKSLSAGARRRGQSFFQNGLVHELKANDPGVAYSAEVIDKHVYKVGIFYDPAQGWRGEWSCPLKSNCGPVFAMLSALLAQHRSAAVRSLSASSPAAAAAV